jgi:eukaryotic-like serine/threonine-protein kinase
MDRTSREGKDEAPGLDETLPSGDHGPSPLAPPKRLATEPQGLDETLDSHPFPRPLDETLPSGDHGPSPLTKSTAGGRASLPNIERGIAIGRYTVVERIGSGTMGLVVAAFDPTLDRKVAIKLVQLDATGTTSGRQRLMREAQAMAKLQHPNVVTVFEVGTFNDRVFLAMEYVAGATLQDWLAAKPRTQREIITAFVAAGRGLAAAHRAGIVHRDFKPANVLVDDDGRVRVADFGLATAPTDAPAPPVEVSRDSDPGPLGMTKTGAVLGTPAYMSPEQHRGAAADARADQFSFCVALYEALYKVLPFEGASFLVYQDNVLSGRIREVARSSDVPARVRKVLLRGLATAPGDRHPNMEALLAELSHDPVSQRRRVALVGGAILAAGGLAFAVARTTGDDDPCATADAPVASLFGAAQQRGLEDSFRASGSPAAASMFAHTSRLLEERVTALRAARREACVATSVRHEQSAELLDRRIHCVDERAAETTALIDVLTEHHDVDTLMKGVDAVLRLPSVDVCADRAALLSDVPAPPAAQRARIETLATKVARIDAMVEAGIYAKSLDELTPIIREADALGYAPLAAETHSVAASAHLHLEHTEQAVAELRRTGELAAAARDDKLAARSWTSLFAAVGNRQGKFDEAKGIEQVAAAAVVRAGNEPSLAAALENARGLVELAKDRYEAAAQHFQESARLSEKGGRSQLSDVAYALNNAGTALLWAEKYDQAQRALERSLAIRVEALGAEHPDVAHSHYGLGILFDSIGKPEQALVEFEKSAAITAKAYPADNANIGKSLVSVGLVLGELERVDEALDNQKRAVAIFESHREDNRRLLSTAYYNLGLASLTAGHHNDAVTTMQKGLTFAETQHGVDSEEVASLLGGLVVAEDLVGDHVKAQQYGQRSLAIRRKHLEPGQPDNETIGRLLGDLAQNANLRGKPQEAMQLIDRALAIIEKPGAPELAVRFEMRKIRATALVALRRADPALADATASRDGYLASKQPTGAAAAQLVLADALWLKGNQREAIAEANAALAAVNAQPKPDADVVAKAREWLAKHAP